MSGRPSKKKEPTQQEVDQTKAVEQVAVQTLKGEAVFDLDDRKPPYDYVVKGSEIDGMTVADVIERTPEYVVFISTEYTVESNAKQAVAERLKEAQLHAAYRRWGLVNSMPTQELLPHHRHAYLTMLGNGLAAIFSGNAESAKESIDRAEAYRNARTEEQAKIWFFKSSASCFVALFIICLLVLWVQTSVVNAPNVLPDSATMTVPDETGGEASAAEGAKTAQQQRLDSARALNKIPFVLCYMFGITGALLSVLTRLNSLPSDASAGKTIHYIDGASRIILGGIFAVIGSMAFYADIFLGFLDPTAEAYGIAVCLVATVSGASERLIPSMITSFENKAASAEPAAPQNGGAAAG